MFMTVVSTTGVNIGQCDTDWLDTRAAPFDRRHADPRAARRQVLEHGSRHDRLFEDAHVLAIEHLEQAIMAPEIASRE
jgi:hypothetical protein